MKLSMKSICNSSLRRSGFRGQFDKFRLVQPALILCGTLSLCVLSTSAQTISEARDVFQELSKVQILISEEKYGWVQEKESIQELISITETEIETLDEKITSLEESSSQSDKLKSDLSKQIDEIKTNAVVFKNATPDFEIKIKAILPRLPKILMQEIAPLVQRLPTDPAKSKLPASQRLQTIVGIMTQIEKFNSAPTLNSEIQELPGGASAEVKTLYLGLGIAFFTDANQEYSGYGVPSSEGWQWTKVDGDAATRISQAIAIYENTREPAFVSLPVQIK